MCCIISLDYFNNLGLRSLPKTKLIGIKKGGCGSCPGFTNGSCMLAFQDGLDFSGTLGKQSIIRGSCDQ